jgi:hypothetical protein
MNWLQVSGLWECPLLQMLGVLDSRDTSITTIVVLGPHLGTVGHGGPLVLFNGAGWAPSTYSVFSQRYNHHSHIHITVTPFEFAMGELRFPLSRIADVENAIQAL